MSFPITTIIFSKNRACQLDLLLRNLNMPSTVLYTYDPGYKSGYRKLINMYPSVKFIKETDFKKDLFKLLLNGNDYVLFLVDDDVMIRHFSQNCPEFREFQNNPQIICLSMRMSPDYRYKGLPKMNNNKWEWGRFARGSPHYHEYLRIWGFPMAVGANMFRRQDVLATLRLAQDIKNPSFLETALNLKVPNRPLALCFDKAKFINNEANQVQKDFFSHTVGILPDDLEVKFVGGERLSLTDIIEKSAKTRDYFMKTEYVFESY